MLAAATSNVPSAVSTAKAKGVHRSSEEKETVLCITISNFSKIS